MKLTDIHGHLAGDKPEPTPQVEPPSSLPWHHSALYKSNGRGISGPPDEHNVSIAIAEVHAHIAHPGLCVANAAFIVTACNSHHTNIARIAKLEAALQLVVDWRSMTERQLITKYPDYQSERLINGSSGLNTSIFKQARDALKS